MSDKNQTFYLKVEKLNRNLSTNFCKLYWNGAKFGHLKLKTINCAKKRWRRLVDLLQLMCLAGGWWYHHLCCFSPIWFSCLFSWIHEFRGKLHKHLLAVSEPILGGPGTNEKHSGENINENLCSTIIYNLYFYYFRGNLLRKMFASSYMYNIKRFSTYYIKIFFV